MSFGDQQVRPGKYIKIESGKPQEIRILNDSPIEFISHGFGDTETECQGTHCASCQEGSEPSQRFLTNVFSHDYQRVMIWKYPPSVHRNLVAIEKECSEAGKKLSDVDLKVDTTGSNKTKKYTVTMKIGQKAIPSGLALHRLDLPF